MAGKVTDRDMGYRALMSRLKDLSEDGKTAVYVGVRAKEGAEIVIIAASNEFGTDDGHVPERSYLRRTVDERQSDILDELAGVVRDAVDGKRDVTAGLDRLGVKAVGWVKETIKAVDTPPNAPSTIRRKHGADNPLIDTGQNLRNRIDHEVRKG